MAYDPYNRRGLGASVDSFNNRFGSSSPGAAQSRNTMADASGMKSVVAAADRQRAANRANPKLGDAPANSIVGSSGRTLTYNPGTGRATIFAPDGSAQRTVTAGTSAQPGRQVQTPQRNMPSPRAVGAEGPPTLDPSAEDPLTAFGGPGRDVGIQPARLSDATQRVMAANPGLPSQAPFQNNTIFGDNPVARRNRGQALIAQELAKASLPERRKIMEELQASPYSELLTDDLDDLIQMYTEQNQYANTYGA